MGKKVFSIRTRGKIDRRSQVDKGSSMSTEVILFFGGRNPREEVVSTWRVCNHDLRRAVVQGEEFGDENAAVE